MNNLGNDLDIPKASKKVKTSHQQMLNNLKANTGDKFKYLWDNDNLNEYDYE